MRASTLHPPRSLRLVLATLLALTTALFLALASAAPAGAHAVLVSSSPSDGETFTEAPTEVSLTFNENLIDIGGEIAVVDASQTDWAAGDFTVDGPTATAPLKDGMPGGNYELRWQVVSADGHPISGIIPFSIEGSAVSAADEGDSADAADGADGGDTTGGTQVDGVGGNDTADPSADAGDAATSDVSSDAQADAENTGAGDTETTGFFGGIAQPWRTILIGLIGAALALGIAALVITVRRRSATGRTGGSGGGDAGAPDAPNASDSAGESGSSDASGDDADSEARS